MKQKRRNWFSRKELAEIYESVGKLFVKTLVDIRTREYCELYWRMLGSEGTFDLKIKILYIGKRKAITFTDREIPEVFFKNYGIENKVTGEVYQIKNPLTK